MDLILYHYQSLFYYSLVGLFVIRIIFFIVITTKTDSIEYERETSDIWKYLKKPTTNSRYFSRDANSIGNENQTGLYFLFTFWWIIDKREDLIITRLKKIGNVFNVICAAMIFAGVLFFSRFQTVNNRFEKVEVDWMYIRNPLSERDLNHGVGNLNHLQLKYMKELLEEADCLVTKYNPNKLYDKFSPSSLRVVLEKWGNDQDEKKPLEDVVSIIGAAFGQDIVNGKDFEWKTISIRAETEMKILHKKYFISLSPFLVVENILTRKKNHKTLEETKASLDKKIFEVVKQNSPYLKR